MISKKIKVIILVIFTLIFAVGAFIYLNKKEYVATDATTPARVNAATPINIFEEPNVNADRVQLDSEDEPVELSTGMEVTIVSEKNDWCKIIYKLEDEGNIEGYVEKKYLVVTSGMTTDSITGFVSENTVLYRNPASGSSFVYDGDKRLVLEENESVKIISNSIYEGEKWYKISFDYNGNPYQGYINSKYILVNYNAAVNAKIIATEELTLKSKINGNNLMLNGNIIKLENNTPILVIGTQKSDEKVYDYVEVILDNSKVSGYVSDDNVLFEDVEFEKNYVNKTELVLAQAEEEKIVPRKKPRTTAKPVVKTTEKPISDKEFKEKMEKAGFPSSYIYDLAKLHEKYPYWEFEAYETGLDWADVVEAESRVGLNLLPSYLSSEWKSKAPGAYDEKTGSYIAYDGSNWVTASDKAVKYYLDPRNFLNEVDIFQFEDLTYQKAVQSRAGTEIVLQGTPMYKTTFNYNDGKKSKSISYSQTYMDAAAASGVSPYFLAARTKQEVVTSSTSFSSSVTNSSGVQNFYNIGANNSTVAGGAIASGLSYARASSGYMRPWTNHYRAIVGGAMFIGENYINIGQNTMYFQKFNVTDISTFNHQYMANIMANVSEAEKAVQAYGTAAKSMNITFVIPVYLNMPTNRAAIPSGGDTTDKVIRVSDLSNAKSGNNYLKSLKLTYSQGNKIFRPTEGENTFTVDLESWCKRLRIAARAANSNASVSGCGTFNLKEGRNTFYVTVTSDTGSARKYKIIANVAKKDVTASDSSSDNSASETDNTSKNNKDNSSTSTGSAVE